MRWKEIKIKTTNQAFPAINNILSELEVEGIFKESITDKTDNILIKAYFEDDKSLNKKIKMIKDKISSLKKYDLDIGSGKIKVIDVQEEDWANNWKENFKPKRITESIVIKPTWEKYQAKSDDIVIEIDPGQAFGTGYHETTSSCLKLLEKYLSPQASLLDIGTGTGLLAIAGAKLGATPILGLDIDSTAVEIARKNAKLNQVEDKVNFIEGNLVDSVTNNYDIVVANLLPHIILELIPDLSQILPDSSYFILSGIIDDKLTEIKNKLIQYNLEVKETVQKNEWVTIFGTRS